MCVGTHKQAHTNEHKQTRTKKRKLKQARKAPSAPRVRKRHKPSEPRDPPHSPAPAPPLVEPRGDGASQRREMSQEEGALFCVCAAPNDGGAYVCCDVCEGWFHPECLNYVKLPGSPPGETACRHAGTGGELRWRDGEAVDFVCARAPRGDPSAGGRAAGGWRALLGQGERRLRVRPGW